jgi:retron-type reverse transcriptase
VREDFVTLDPWFCGSLTFFWQIYVYFHMKREHRLFLERELLTLQHELLTQRYNPGAYTTFTIREPKTRLISAAPYRDRVVHHALCNVIEPLFERTCIYDSYACRPARCVPSLA